MNGEQWTIERVTVVATRWADGASAAEIAAELGNVSRNAVLGKIHRLNLPARQNGHHHIVRNPRKPRKQRTPQQQKRQHNGFHWVNGRERAPEFSPTPLPPQPVIDSEIPMEQRIHSLLDLTSDTCKWPVGNPSDPDFFFCGGKADGPSPYCAAHCAIAYRVPPRPDRPANWFLQKPWMMARQK